MADATLQATAALEPGQDVYLAPQLATVPYLIGSIADTPHSSSLLPALDFAPTPLFPATFCSSTQNPARESSWFKLPSVWRQKSRPDDARPPLSVVDV